MPSRPSRTRSRASRSSSREHASPPPVPLARTRSGTAAARKRAREENSEDEDEPPTKKKRTKKKTEDPEDTTTAHEIETYIGLARGLPRMFNPFGSIESAIQFGKAASLPDDEQKLIKKDLSPEVECELQFMYDCIVGIREDLRRKIEDSTFAQLKSTIKALTTGRLRARGDDARGIKTRVHIYAAPDPNKKVITLSPTSGKKDDRGFNHQELGRLLCPMKRRDEFDNDRHGTLEKLLGGTIRVVATAMPIFMYDEKKYNPAFILSGFAEGYLLVRTWRHIFLGPGAALAARSGKARASNAQIHGMSQVTFESIAYAALHSRFGISASPAWIEIDGKFNYQEFYFAILEMFRLDPVCAAKLIAWWNKQVFGHEDGAILVKDKAEDNDDTDNDVAEAKAQVTARNAPAETSSVPPASDAGEATCSVHEAEEPKENEDEDEDEDEPTLPEPADALRTPAPSSPPRPLSPLTPPPPVDTIVPATRRGRPRIQSPAPAPSSSTMPRSSRTRRSGATRADSTDATIHEAPDTTAGSSTATPPAPKPKPRPRPKRK